MKRNKENASKVKCVQSCSPKILTKNECVCTSKPEKGINGYWCYVDCPLHRKRLVKRGWTGKLYDGVTSPSRQQKRCLSYKKSDRNYEYMKCTGKEVKYSLIITYMLYLTYWFKFYILMYKKYGVLSIVGVSLRNRKLSVSDVSVAKKALKSVRDVIDKVPDDQLLKKNISIDTYNNLASLLDTSQDGFFLSNLFSEILNVQQKLGIEEPTPIINMMASRFPDRVLSEMVRGGHFWIDDDGQLFDEIRNAPKAFKRGSSHYKLESFTKKGVKPTGSGDQYGITERLFGYQFHLLTGVRVLDNDRRVSWFQFENAPWQLETVKQALDNIENNFYHAVDATVYLSTIIGHKIDQKLLGSVGVFGPTRNIGPYGASATTEFNPGLIGVNTAGGYYQQPVFEVPGFTTGITAPVQQIGGV